MYIRRAHLADDFEDLRDGGGEETQTEADEGDDENFTQDGLGGIVAVADRRHRHHQQIDGLPVGDRTIPIIPTRVGEVVPRIARVFQQMQESCAGRRSLKGATMGV